MINEFKKVNVFLVTTEVVGDSAAWRAVTDSILIKHQQTYSGYLNNIKHQQTYSCYLNNIKHQQSYS